MWTKPEILFKTGEMSPSRRKLKQMSNNGPLNNYGTCCSISLKITIIYEQYEFFFSFFFFLVPHQKIPPSASLPCMECVCPSGTDKGLEVTAVKYFLMKIVSFLFFGHCNEHQSYLTLCTPWKVVHGHVYGCYSVGLLLVRSEGKESNIWFHGYSLSVLDGLWGFFLCFFVFFLQLMFNNPRYGDWFFFLAYFQSLAEPNFLCFRGKASSFQQCPAVAEIHKCLCRWNFLTWAFLLIIIIIFFFYFFSFFFFFC